MITPELKMILTSSDITDFETGQPENGESFATLIQCLIGEKGHIAADTFDLIVLSPDRLAPSLSENNPLSGRGYLFVNRWDATLIRATIEDWLRKSQAETWKEVAHRLCRFMFWEYEDHPDID